MYYFNAWAKAMEKLSTVIFAIQPLFMVQEVLKTMHKKKIHGDKKKVDNVATPIFLTSQYPGRILSLFYQLEVLFYPLPYYLNYPSTSLGYLFLPYSMTPSALPTSLFSYPASNLFSPLGLPTQSPYFLYNTNFFSTNRNKQCSTKYPMA